MSTPYTYRIFHIPTKMWYYGVKFSKNCHPDDFWVTYYTSSKLVKALIEHFGKDSFIIKRIKKFSTKSEAVRWEQMFLTRINAASREDWLNQTNGNGNYKLLPPKGPLHWNYGKTHSEETKQKMRKPKTELHKQKISQSRLGVSQSFETIQKRASKNKGQKRSLEQIKTMKEASQRRFKQKHIWVTKDGIDKQIILSQFEEFTHQGFVRGRSKGMNGLKYM